jgi:hypothetical protein
MRRRQAADIAHHVSDAHARPFADGRPARF